MNYQDLAAPGVQKLSPYIPGKPISELERELGIKSIIKLASNENPLGPSPMALDAIQSSMHELALYPDGNGFELKKALSDRYQVSPECITLGNGSNDVLVLLAEAFLTPEMAGMYSQYSFAVYPIAIQAVGAIHQQVSALSWDSTSPLGCDLPAMLSCIDKKTRLIFIANPNNPTGSSLDARDLYDFLQQVPEHVIVVLDEAYLEYMLPEDKPDSVKWLDEFNNLVLTRTFSKAYGLAGLRVGYAISNQEIANVINRIRQPFNVNSMALLAAQTALDDVDFLTRSSQVNTQGMQFLEETCHKLNLRYAPSKGNFLLIDFAADGMSVFNALLHKGIITRPVSNYGLPHCLRVSIGTQQEMQRLSIAMEEVCG